MLKYGMLGGGNGGSIASTHYRTAKLDGLAELVCGCFSRNDEANKEQGKNWNVEDERVYKDYIEMAERESMRADKIDFVVIATPNSTHYEMVKIFLNYGIHVFCEKPLTLFLDEAEELTALAEEKGLVLGVNYTYSGYPMIHQAHEMVKNGEIGEIIKVVSEYKQDGQIIPNPNFRSWHFSEEIAGKTACTANIGTHIEYLVSYVSGLKIDKISCVFDHVLDNFDLETDFTAMIKYHGGATGVMIGSKTAMGEDCNINIRIFGTKGAIEWSHITPQLLKVALIGQPTMTYTCKRDYLYPNVKAMTRLSFGQVEGYQDAAANIYREFYEAIEGKKSDFRPNGHDGINGVKFVDACFESATNDGQWVKIK